MAWDILEGMDNDVPDNPDRQLAQHYKREANERHLIVPRGYKTDAIRTTIARRSDGWNIANATEKKTPDDD